MLESLRKCAALHAIAFLVAASSATAEVSGANADSRLADSSVKGQRPTIALALGGGGIRGAALIGVLRVLQREQIPIDYIAGASIGSVIGGLYCAGVPLNDMEKMMQTGDLQKAYARGSLSLKAVRYGLAKVRFIVMRNRPSAGLISGKKFTKYLEKNLPENKQNIQDLNIPFCIQATCLSDGKAHRLTSGNLAQGMLASCAIPPIVRPAEIDGKLYVDGSLWGNTPVRSAKQFSPDLVIAVPIDAELQDLDQKQLIHTVQIAQRMTDIIVNSVDRTQLPLADVVIKPEIAEIPILSNNTSYITPAVQAGERACESALPAIRKAIADWKSTNVAQKIQVSPSH